jgi:hypothetical protein
MTWQPVSNDNFHTGMFCSLLCRGGHGSRHHDGHRGGRGGYGSRRDGGGGYRGGGGGGGRGDGRRGGGTRYQSSYVGHKRGRDEPEPIDPKKQLIQRLLKLGEPGPLAEVCCCCRAAVV